MSDVSTFLNGYSADLQQQVAALLDDENSGAWLIKKYPKAHDITTAKSLYQYAQTLKQDALRSSAPISKVVYDDKIHVLHNALGLHTYVSRVQGNKLKAKNEIRIGALFRHAPEAFLRMILVHELAHLKEKTHNKAFYKLCCYMEPDYHQIEFDVRVYLCHKERFGDLWRHG